MASKHRLIFLGTLLVGLTLFYFGVNTWMEQKAKENTPPPPVVIKQPEEIKREEKPERAEGELKKQKETKEQRKVLASATTQKSVQISSEQKEVNLTASPQKVAEEEKPKKGVVKEIKKIKKREAKSQNNKESSVAKKDTLRVSKEIKKSLKTYVFQIGAFRDKRNAFKALRIAKKKGFYAKIIKKGEFYKVYIYAKAPSYTYAYRNVKRYFRDAFPVRR